MRGFSLIFGSILVASAGIAACAAEDSDWADSPGEGAQEADLTALELKCKSRTTTATFDVSPGFGGAVIEGEYKLGAVRSLFVCNNRLDSSTNVATCTERPQNAHPGRWSVSIAKSGNAYEATLDRGGDAGADAATDAGAGATEKFSCLPPGRGDAGAADGGDGAPPPVPTYAVVGPIINQTCGGCHTGVFNSLAKVKQRKVQMISVISAGSMPRGNSQWRTTENGEKVLDFLRNSAEL